MRGPTTGRDHPLSASGPETPVTFDELLLAFLRDRGDAKSAVRDRAALQHLYPVFTEQRLSEIRALDVRRYIRARQQAGAAASTINKEIGVLSRAMRWANRELGQDAPLITLEEQARAARRGLWALPADQQIPPWEFRHAKSALLSDAQRSAGCQPHKRTCKDMATCEEAKFYLTTCALGKLDKDGDGVPCEALCR